jgi:hypothetical protein
MEGHEVIALFFQVNFCQSFAYMVVTQDIGGAEFTLYRGPVTVAIKQPPPPPPLLSDSDDEAEPKPLGSMIMPFTVPSASP